MFVLLIFDKIREGKFPIHVYAIRDYVIVSKTDARLVPETR